MHAVSGPRSGTSRGVRKGRNQWRPTGSTEDVIGAGRFWGRGGVGVGLLGASLLLEMCHEASVGSSVAAGTTVKGPGSRRQRWSWTSKGADVGRNVRWLRTVCPRSEARLVWWELEGW